MSSRLVHQFERGRIVRFCEVVRFGEPNPSKMGRNRNKDERASDRRRDGVERSPVTHLWNPLPSIRITMNVFGSTGSGSSKLRTYAYRDPAIVSGQVCPYKRQKAKSETREGSEGRKRKTSQEEDETKQRPGRAAVDGP